MQKLFVSFTIMGLLLVFGWSALAINRASPVSITITSPKSNGAAICAQWDDHTTHFTVGGIATGLGDSLTILLWVKPISPGSELSGYYLQRGPNNGVQMVLSDGTWSAIAQIGNASYPPHRGDILEILAVVLPKSEATALLTKPGVVSSFNPPPGVITDRSPSGKAKATSYKVRVHV